ncbi:AraC family transcriptional regulator [Chitinophaga sancti]|uniref:AraC-type DNA-binding protein n=1 Tax=Chitinophaga sancti TaxID=1004 RepID=A0A1K1S0X6_9BACT|nr:helix-turn-helix transcriptional regulator [Chitinophaga sancti]WQD59729.1 helix-turn-helix transcriptional regulator [Chitinophaga sancti]WQG88140.1 helix-turn-helix transcriptional regulator [Chitinophaga sancti]SFW78080.1 AraC-type DNA-binding protein [Chitinophaga sancti]
MQHIPIRTNPGFSIRDIKGMDMVQSLHRHDFYYLLILQKGAGTHSIDFTDYTIRDHSIFLLRPGQVHLIHLHPGSTGYLIQFHQSFDPSPLLRNAAQQNHYQLENSAIWCTQILEEFTRQNDKYEEVIKSLLHILFIQLIRTQQTPATNDQLQTLQDLIATNIHQYKQVSDYAALLHLSSYQLNAITKSALGKTCSTLINDHIILEAKRQLLATTNLVNEIAWHLGYEDVSYFIRFFKKHSGYSPEAFRQKFK